MGAAHPHAGASTQPPQITSHTGLFVQDARASALATCVGMGTEGRVPHRVHAMLVVIHGSATGPPRSHMPLSWAGTSRDVLLVLLTHLESELGSAHLSEQLCRTGLTPSGSEGATTLKAPVTGSVRVGEDTIFTMQPPQVGTCYQHLPTGAMQEATASIRSTAVVQANVVVAVMDWLYFYDRQHRRDQAASVQHK